MIYGQTYIEQFHKRAAYDEEKGKWKKWYAWYPVDIKNGRTVWLEYIERRYERYYSRIGWKTVYRLIVKNSLQRSF